MKYTGERLIPVSDAEMVHPSFQHKMEAEHYARYQFAGKYVSGKQVLDLGCGTGYGSDFIFKNFSPSRVVSLEISEEAFSYAKENFEKEGLQFHCGNAEEIPFEKETFDIVICFELIEHVKDFRRVFQEIRRVLKKEGVLVISTPRKKDKPRNEFHTHEFSFEEFSVVLGDLFGQENFQFFVQNNLFASMISDGKHVNSFKKVFSLDEFSMKSSDYFVAVCGNVPNSSGNEVVIENDFYITNLENDVEVLRNAEKEHLRRIESADKIVRSHAQWIQNLEKEKLELQKKVKDLEGKLKRRGFFK